MQLHEQLRALRRDDSPQRQAQENMLKSRDDWCALPPVSEVLADMAAFATSRPLAECPALAGLFEEGSAAAAAFANSFISATARSLATHPLGHVAMRHLVTGNTSMLTLARAGRVSLTLVAVDGAGATRQAPLRSASFSSNEQWDHVLAGAAKADLIECRTANTSQDISQVSLHSRAITLSPGRVISRDCRRTALHLREVEGNLVTLRLQRRREDSAPTREYDLATGSLIRQAAGDPRDSRFELMLPLLGKMGRADAAPLIAGMALEPGSDGLRWQALRECLGLDTLTGFRTLTEMASRPDDPLANNAGALRAQLIETYPQLAEVC